MSMHFQGQPRHHRPRSKPFPWVRLMIACLLTILFLLGAALQILSMGNIIASYWLSIIPPLVAIIALLLPLFQWLFPLSPDAASTSASPPQGLSATATTPSQTSVSVASVWNVPYPHNPFFTCREAFLTHVST